MSDDDAPKATSRPVPISHVRRRCACGFSASARSAGVADELINGHVVYAVDPDRRVPGSHWRND